MYGYVHKNNGKLKFNWKKRELQHAHSIPCKVLKCIIFLTPLIIILLLCFFSLPVQPPNSRKKSSRHSSKYKSGSSQERENESEQGYISDDDKHSRPVFTEDTESPTVSAVLLTVISIIILLIFIILMNHIFEYKWPNRTMTPHTAPVLY